MTQPRNRAKPEEALGNVGTSKVLYALVDGKTTLADISEHLGITSPSVIEQLRRLQRAGLVKLGAKEGKYQHYEVNSEGLSRLFLDNSTKLLVSALTDRTIYPEDKMLRDRLREPRYWQILTGGKNLQRSAILSRFRNKLAKNISWASYLIAFLKHYAKAAGLGVTISEAVRGFESGLRVQLSVILDEDDSKTWSRIDEPKKELLELLHIWSRLIAEMKPLQEAAHESSVEEMVGQQVLERLESARKEDGS